jgi:hypothetical protein
MQKIGKSKNKIGWKSRWFHQKRPSLFEERAAKTACAAPPFHMKTRRLAKVTKDAIIWPAAELAASTSRLSHTKEASWRFYDLSYLER